MCQEGREKQKPRDYRGRPHNWVAPLGRDTVKMSSKRERDQRGDDEPAVVQSDRNAGDPAKLDLCPHFRDPRIPYPLSKAISRRAVPLPAYPEAGPVICFLRHQQTLLGGAPPS